MPDSGVFRKRTIKRQGLGPPEVRRAELWRWAERGRGGEAGGPALGTGLQRDPPRRLEAGGPRASRPWPGLQGDRDRRATGRRAAARPPPQQTNGPSVVGGPGPPAPGSADGRLQRWKSTVPVWRPEVGDQGGGGRLLSWLLAGGSLATSSSLAGAASPRPLPRACVRVQMSPLYKGSSHVGLRAHPAPARPHRN